MEYEHYSVMKKEAVEALECQDGKIYVDATLGGGGHSEEILKQIGKNSRLIAFDVDEDAIKAASERLKDYKNLTIVHDSYTNIKKVLQNLGIEKITGGILFDLGASGHQFMCAERGFSFSKDAPLDMRFNPQADLSAFDVVNGYGCDDLVKIFSEFGEERFSKRIAKKIVEQRRLKTIDTTVELADLIISATPNIKSAVHPATRVFQAVRIEVNSELSNIKNTLNEVFALFENGAIISVMSFHSLEDRIVKQFFKERSQTEKVNKYKKQSAKFRGFEILTKRPIVASESELKENPPSRSAKLRAARYVEKN